ncbi:hypothetical protein LZ32DRAFT_654351 [Colletotrichum eremochloae]|uniref:Uncharacterized protein n=1 Tax=Colletotrichum sublineola TaxID=1173701 RepID=A0A066XK37_COLSU|nr:hypothetical protein LY78DRAFT_678766 [Colletotrichum sublineola]KAK2018140.1 hypothetical protein LZ32DRAFT_654351 [Colletotrichum eremochloae]KDN66101.1 hypothetical protein CSUB01_01552 [Colletotrichum sublineola]
MSCGHVLRSRLRDCGAGAQCKGERWQPAFINDSCAECHRPLNYSQNRMLHEAEHAILMTGYRRAKASGDEEGMRRLRRAMLEHTRSSRQMNFATSLVREERYGDVRWPVGGGGGGPHASGNEENGP